jgi:mono/diheme cytochrome c family protein
MRTRRLVLGLLGSGLIGLAVGCDQNGKPSNSGPSSAPPAVAEAAAPTDGKGVFEHSCAKCHSVTGGSGGRMKGPDLSHVGGQADHDAAWIAEHVRNPKSHKPGSRMPAFEGKLTPEQIKNVSEFLAAKK